MMKKRQYQSGAAHVIAIICLVLALVTALGWIFYQNFMQEKPLQNDNTASKVMNFKECTEAPGSLLQATYPEVCVTKDGKQFPNSDQQINNEGQALKKFTTTRYGTKLSFEYPVDWTVQDKITQENGVDVEQISLSDASKDNKVKMVLTSTGQYGGACDSDAKIFPITHLEHTPIPGFAGASYYEGIKKLDGKYYATTMILNDQYSKSAKVGASGCLLFNTNKILKPATSKKNVTFYAEIISSTLHDQDGREKPFVNESDIKKAFMDASYIKAKSTLLSIGNSQA